MAVINYKAVRRSLKSLRSQVGSAMVGFIQAGTGAIVRNLQDKAREVQLSVKDFGAVGDGTTDDTANINKAIAAASAGVTVYFPPGDYKVSPVSGNYALTALPVGVNLFMDKGAWLVSDGTEVINFIRALGSNVITCNIDGGSYPSSGGASGTWGSASNGITAAYNAEGGHNAEDVVVCNSEIKNLAYPILTWGAKSWRVYGNWFHRYKLTGALMVYPTGYTCTGNVIYGNRFEDSGDTAVAFWNGGVGSTGIGSYNIIANNTAKDCNQFTAGYAYDVELGDPTYQHHFLFIGNTYEQTKTGFAFGLGGITFGGVADSSVIGNVLKGSLNSTADVGITTTSSARILVQGNHVENWRGAGINTNGSTGTTVSGNYVKDCGATTLPYVPIRIAFDSDTSEVTVVGNTIFTSSTYAYYGAGVASIYCLSAASKTVKNIDIRGNTITNPSDYGIACFGTSGIPQVNVNVSGNTINGTGDATFFQRNPIYFNYVNELTCQGNTIYDPARGIIASNCVGGTISENDIKGTRTIATLWDLTGSTNLRLRNNTCRATVTTVLAAPTSVLTTTSNGNVAQGNTKLLTEAKGVTGAIATGATVSHGLTFTPTVVVITPADTGVTDFYVSALGASTFTVNYSGGGTHAFYWQAYL